MRSLKVVIIGHGFTSRLGMIRAIAKTGAETTIIDFGRNDQPIDCSSKYINHIYYCHSNEEDELIKVLLGKCVDKKQKSVIIPLNDFYEVFIDNHTDILKEHFVFPNIHYRTGAVSEWMNKEKQKALAHSIGLNTAHSINVEIKDGHYQLPESISYPCFTKTRTYMEGYKHTLHKCENEQELRKVMDSLASNYPNFTLMIEEYKEIETEYAVVGVSDGKEVIIPGIIEILVMGKGKGKGVACQGKIMPLIGFENLVEKFKKVILGVGFAGLFDIDFYLSGGEYYFGEINLRIGGSGYAVTKMGVNLPAIFIRSISGESTEELTKTISSTGIFCNERICMENWYEGDLSNKEYKSILRSSDFGFIKDKDDPKPEKKFKKIMREKTIKRIIKQCLFMQSSHKENKKRRGH